MFFTNLEGKVIKNITLHPTALQRKYFYEQQWTVVPIREAKRLKPESSILYIGFGKPQEQLFADTRTGTITRWQGQDTGLYKMQFSPDGRYAYSIRGFKDVAPYGKHRDGRERFVSVNTVQVTNMKQPNRFTDIISGLVDVENVDWKR